MNARYSLANARFVWLTIILVVLAGCQSKQGFGVFGSSGPGPVAEEIQRRGYHSTASVVLAPTAWESSTFRMRNRRLLSFRADRPLPNTSDYYCRFSFFEETYDSTDDARHRLANIHLPNPEGPSGERDYLSTMRAGFRVENTVYVLQTDASIFWDEVQRLTKSVADVTPGAEISPTDRVEVSTLNWNR